jgi:lysozyme family protein
MTDDRQTSPKSKIAAAIIAAAVVIGVPVSNLFIQANVPVAQSEGGFIDHAADPGGATRYGITEDVARAWGYEGPMAKLPFAVAVAIWNDYWDRVWGDSIGQVYPALATRVHDAAINAGVTRGPRWLQQCLNSLNRRGRDYADIGVDGRMGPRTMAALRAYADRRGGAGTEGERRLYACHVVRQGDHYYDLGLGNSRFELFTNGWYERIPIPLPALVPDSTLDSIRTTITYPTD